MCIGDYVLLRDIVHGGFLSTEGILSEDVVLNEDLNSFFDSLFCVHLQRQYSASRDLQAFLQKYGDDKQNHDESTEKYLYALKVSFFFSSYFITNLYFSFLILYYYYYFIFLAWL